MDRGFRGFFSRYHGAVTPPFVFESIIRVPVKSVQGKQDYLEWMGKLGFLNCGTTPGDALVFQGQTVLLLRADSNVGIPFPMKQGN